MNLKKGGPGELGGGDGQRRVCLQKISPSAATPPSGLEEEEEEEEEEFWDEERTVQSQAG